VGTPTPPTAAAEPARARWLPARVQALLFDLDGTLLDTLPDIALALNRSLAECGFGSVSALQARSWIGRGGAVLVERALGALGARTDEPQRAHVVRRYFEHYAALQAAGESAALPFAGVEAALVALRAQGLKLAVVTNKLHALAVGALAHARLGESFELVVGGDSCAFRKPDPEPLRHACRELSIAASHCVMVGDSINDVLAARAAGMAVVCVPYGYNEGQPAEELPCDALISGLDELPTLLR
jgi:phosphoglycolate phosphatase